MVTGEAQFRLKTQVEIEDEDPEGDEDAIDEIGEAQPIVRKGSLAWRQKHEKPKNAAKVRFQNPRSRPQADPKGRPETGGVKRSAGGREAGSPRMPKPRKVQTSAGVGAIQGE